MQHFATNIFLLLIQSINSSFSGNGTSSNITKEPPLVLGQFFGDFTLYLLLAFTLIFVIAGIICRRGHLDTVVQRTNNEDPYEEWYKELTLSSTLAGFSITALVFVLAFQELATVQRMVEFFLIGFVLEMLSFVFYKYMVRVAYDYYATVFQFAGLLAILNGFFVFILQKMSLSPTIFIIMIIGYTLFFILGGKQLKTYFN